MKALRFIPLLIGIALIEIGSLIMYAATGLGWLGENIINLAFEKEAAS